ncbi:hypothetical protein ITP53_11275 [Nonomuraea sp. K274]|uniref:Tail assembly chaperone n=1 Tax=Nonomuraea cypriaca TaxID=1187855 RepID=A0A931EW45_9ACTN|nr:hypothetical protein [Nonomuraea cypriaca]MBF8186319.1 hypothetical protein [Nonomuraea cypriaca]
MTYTYPENEHDEPQAETYDSWDEFWSEVEAAEERRTETIKGVEVEVPRELTVRFARRAELLQDSSRMEDVTSLLADLYSKEIVEQWIDGGMGLPEFQTVLAWSIAHASGKPMSFREALASVKNLHQAKAEAGGKARTRRGR